MTTIIANRSAFFKVVNMLAPKMESFDAQGNAINCRKTKLATAYHVAMQLIDADAIKHHVIQLFNREQGIELVKLIASAGITKAEEPQAAKASNKALRDPKKKPSKKSNTAKRPTKQADVYTYPEIQFEELSFSFEVTEAQRNTVNTAVRGWVDMTNKKQFKDCTPIYNHYYTGRRAITDAANFNELQAAVCGFFMESYIANQARKIIEYGVGYKAGVKQLAEKLESMDAVEIAAWENQSSYENASSSYGNITQFDVSDLVNEVMLYGYAYPKEGEKASKRKGTRKVDPTMLDSMMNLFRVLFYRTTNAARVMMNANKRQAKAKKAKKEELQVVPMETTTENDALQLALDMGIFTSEEIRIIEMRLNGMTKTQIDEIVGKRTDRVFDKMKKAFKAA